MRDNLTIGFIGQGWIGKNYADNFVERGYQVVRYSVEPEYCINQDKIKDCDVVFIAVPAATTPAGFDDSIIREVIKYVGEGKSAVIKSTIIPGTTESIQQANPKIYVFHSPEFLTKASVVYDTAHPNRNIIGLPVDNSQYRQLAEQIMNSLPQAPYNLICSARDAEIIKYAGNCWSYAKIIFINLLYDLCQKLNCDYEVVKEAIAADPRLGSSYLKELIASQASGKTELGRFNYGDFHLNPVHKSGRGAGGHCFIKDFAAFRMLYQEVVKDELGLKVLTSLEEKNIALLKNSDKDVDLLKEVYG